MQLESLKIFCDVVRWASFSRGAAENGISQSLGEPGRPSARAAAGREADRPLEAAAGPDAARARSITKGARIWSAVTSRWRTGSRRWRTTRTWSGRSGWPRSTRSGLHHMSQYVETFDELLPRGDVRLEYLHPTRVVESVVGGGGRAGPDLVSPEVARADGDPLARGGDGPGRPPVAPVRRPERGRDRASSTARRSSASTPTCRSAGRSTGSSGSTTCRSRRRWSSTTSRTSSGPSRSRPASRSCPSRPWRARSRRARSWRSGSTARTRHRLTRPLAIIHRRQRPARPDGVAVPRTARPATPRRPPPRRRAPVAPSRRPSLADGPERRRPPTRRRRSPGSRPSRIDDRIDRADPDVPDEPAGFRRPRPSP